MNYSSTSKGTPRYVDAIDLGYIGFSVLQGTSGTSPGEKTLPDCEAVLCHVECNGVLALITDLLGVYIQTYIGDVWVDVAHIQITGDLANDARKTAKINANAAEAMFEDTDPLAANAVRNLMGTKWRYRYVVSAGTGVFNFIVKLQPIG